MNSEFGKIRIEKRTLPEWAAFLIALLPFTFSFLVELLGLPGVVRFVADFLILVCMVAVLLKSSSQGKVSVARDTAPFSCLIAVFLLYTFVSYLFNFQSVFYYIWGMRNNFRFYVAFLIFISFFKERHALNLLKLFDYLFWLHFAVSCVQFFILGYQQDYLGGLFGVEKGCNSYVIVFLIIVVLKSLLSFMNGEEKTSACLLRCGAALFISALAELKVFFIMFILIMIGSAIFTSFSIKKTILLILAGVMLMIAYTVLVSLFDSFENFLSFDYLFEQLFKDNYTSSEDLGRFTAIPQICDTFLTSFSDQAFGMGLGNCDTSTIPLFNTAFYDAYVDIHYSIFSVSFIFLETGFVGLTLFTVFFVAVFVYSLVNFRKKRGNKFFNQMGLIMSLLCLIIMFYNSSLRTEAGYIAYFIMALPFIGCRRGQEQSEVIGNG
ncbi:MAG: hypothetical protein IJO76_03900 [Clostridia bacterium]|nr:hypothetical protein [Clostridia bacterium]